MTTLAYLLDENVDPRLRTAILRHAPDLEVWYVGDPGVPPLHTNDPTILAWCEANDVILVTNNRTSMPVHLKDHLAAGRHVPGIFIMQPGMTLGETAEDLALVGMASREDEYVDLIRFLPLTK